jgi:hypothetical protein
LIEQVVVLAKAFEIFLRDVGSVVVRRARSGLGFAVTGAGAEENFIARPFAVGVQADRGEEGFAVAAGERNAGGGDGFPMFTWRRSVCGRRIRRGMFRRPCRPSGLRLRPSME